METKIFPTMIPLFLWLHSMTWSFNDFHQVMITCLTLLATLTPVLSKPAFRMKLFFLQACRLKDSLRKISDGIRQWASKTLLVAEAYRKLADLINETPTQLTESKVFSGMLTAGQPNCDKWIFIIIAWFISLVAINLSMHGSPSLFLHFFGDNPISASREKLRQRIM